MNLEIDPTASMESPSTPGCGQPDEYDGYENFYDDDDSEEYCNHCSNTGIVNCYCGGDLCCCENHGEMDCPHCSNY